VDHRGALLGDRVRRAALEAESRTLDVGGNGGQALVRREARGGLLVITRAHERVYAAITALEKARQQLGAHEAGGPGKDDPTHPFRVPRRRDTKRVYATTSMPTFSSFEAARGFSTASTALRAAIATASCERSGSRVVSRCS
jgi:hypothetical protein